MVRKNKHFKHSLKIPLKLKVPAFFPFYSMSFEHFFLSHNFSWIKCLYDVVSTLFLFLFPIIFSKCHHEYICKKKLFFFVSIINIYILFFSCSKFLSNMIIKNKRIKKQGNKFYFYSLALWCTTKSASDFTQARRDKIIKNVWKVDLFGWKWMNELIDWFRCSFLMLSSWELFLCDFFFNFNKRQSFPRGFTGGKLKIGSQGGNWNLIGVEQGKLVELFVFRNFF